MSDRPTQNPKNNSKNFGSSNSSLNSSASSISGSTGTAANNGNALNFLAAGQVQQQQQQHQMNNNNVRPAGAVNRQSNSVGSNNPTNDFISFLNANPSVNSQSSTSPNNNGTNSVPGSANSNALNRLETIRQYYMQLSNNLRLITQQLQSTDLTASRRQALLMEQARANAAMQEFTEKILKPISASKQQQQQAQAQNQAHQHQRTQFNNQPGTAPMMQYQGRPPVTQQQQQQQQQPMKNITPSSAPTQNYMQQMQQSGPQSQRPPQMNPNVNLYSQSGLGMIRPIINTATPSGVNRPSTAVNFRPNGPMSVPSVPQSVPPMPSGSPQRPFRPPAAVNVPISQLSNPIINQPIQTSPPSGLLPPGTPKTQQQFIVNRQTYLMAAQQHQTSVAQQQLLFQQRLSLFSRDPTVAINSPAVNQKKKLKGRGAPILALPPVSQLNRPSSSPIRGKIQNFPSPSATSSVPFSTFNAKMTSFPSSYPIGAKLKDLAKQFKLELTDGAEQFLLRIADEFIENLARKSISFASHRKRKLPPAPVTTVKSKKGSVSQTFESIDEIGTELNVSVEDLMLGLDEVINYQPAGNGSIENCRPMVKRAKEATTSSGVNSANNTDNTSGGSTTVATSNHQHRLTMVKKHSSLYQNY